MLKWKTQYPISKHELHIISNVNILEDEVWVNGLTPKVRNEVIATHCPALMVYA